MGDVMFIIFIGIIIITCIYDFFTDKYWQTEKDVI